MSRRIKVDKDICWGMKELRGKIWRSSRLITHSRGRRHSKHPKIYSAPMTDNYHVRVAPSGLSFAIFQFSVASLNLSPHQSLYPCPSNMFLTVPGGLCPALPLSTEPSLLAIVTVTSVQPLVSPVVKKIPTINLLNVDNFLLLPPDLAASKFIGISDPSDIPGRTHFSSRASPSSQSLVLPSCR